MAISHQQAADALRDIHVTETKSRELRRYHEGAPILLMWAAIWTVGYGVTGFTRWGFLIWLPLTIVGIVGTILMTRKFRSNYTPEAWKAQSRKWSVSWGVLAAFWSAVYTVIQPVDPNVYSAFPALLVALSYGLVGTWLMPRYLWLGAALLVLTVFGFFYAADWYAYWMAAVGGVTLLLGSLWLRQA